MRVIPAPLLLERDQLLDALHSMGTGRLVLVSGEAGVGKTALVRQFCEEADEAVSWGACDPMFAPRPLGPFVEIADLEWVLGNGGGPHELVAALVETRDPTILVLEDLHWADEATLDTVRLLARKVEGSKLLVVGTYRDDELDRAHPLRVVLGEINAARVPVPRLSRAAVTSLASDAGLDAEELYRLTSGNSFYVTEAIAAGDDVIPATLRDAVLARAARLSLDARAVLDAIAIAPPRVELWLLEELAAERAAALEECIDAGMIVAGPAGVEFRHELARLAVEESLEPVARRALHRHALAVLGAPPFGGHDAVRLSHHADLAGDVQAVLRFAPEAAACSTAVGAHREAAAHLERALRYGELLDANERAELLQRYSDACFLADRCQDAIEAVKRVLECYRTVGDRQREGQALCLLSTLQMCPGSVVEAEPAGREAVAVLEAFPAGPPLALAYANLAAISMNAEDEEGTRQWAGRAIELAERIGDPDALAHALNSLGTMEFLVGGPTRRRNVERSLTLAQEVGLEPHVLRAYSNMAWAAWRHREYPLAERYLHAGLEHCREPDFDLWRLQHCAHLACVRLEQDRWDDAVALARQAMADPRSSPLPRILGRVVLGLVRARRGDPQSVPLLVEAEALAAGSGELQRIGPAAAARAEAAWLVGDAAAVEAVTRDALALALDRGAAWIAGSSCAGAAAQVSRRRFRPGSPSRMRSSSQAVRKRRPPRGPGSVAGTRQRSRSGAPARRPRSAWPTSS